MGYKNNGTFFCSRFAVVLAYNELIYLFEVNQIIWSLLKWQLLKLITVHRMFQSCEQKQNVVLFNFHNSIKRFWTCKLFLMKKYPIIDTNTVFDDKYFRDYSKFNLLFQFSLIQLHSMHMHFVIIVLLCISDMANVDKPVQLQVWINLYGK